MRDFIVRSDLKRSVVHGYALPLGIEAGELEAPCQGYTLAFWEGEEDQPDTYAFQVVVSHEKLLPIIHRAFDLLPATVIPIVEIGSRDAYRQVDVYMGTEAIPKREFLRVWRRYEPIILEDASIGIGASSDEPFIEVFVDAWKGLAICVPLELRERVEAMLHEFGLEEVPETWPSGPEYEALPGTSMRDVLELLDDQSPDIDELLLQLRDLWQLELDVDPETNVDDAGRQLGLTLWHAVVLADSADHDPDRGAYLSIWADASSLSEMEGLIMTALDERPQWSFNSFYSVDRVAYDERPEELASLPPRRREPKVHLVDVDSWGEPPRSGTGKEARRG